MSLSQNTLHVPGPGLPELLTTARYSRHHVAGGDPGQPPTRYLFVLAQPCKVGAVITCFLQEENAGRREIW